MFTETSSNLAEIELDLDILTPRWYILNYIHSNTKKFAKKLPFIWLSTGADT